MTSFVEAIGPYVDAELSAAVLAESEGDPAEAFRHLERAHVLGQASTRQHVRVHWHMLRWGWRQRSVSECLGQIKRIAGAATLTVLRLVPAGNTGGSNVSAVRSMPVPADLAAIIRQARGDSP